MNSYLVSVYREEKDNRRAFVGVVEDVEKPGKRVFTNIEELWAILNPAAIEKEEKTKADESRAS